MYSFRRLALLLALVLPAMTAILAQSSGSSSNPATQVPDPAQTPTQGQQPAAQTQGQVSVQARIRARRAQRRAAAIHEVYDHLYEAYTGMGYMRFTPGATLQRVNEYSWDEGVTRYFSERLGVTIDGRGNYGTAFIEPEQGAGGNLTSPAISQYAVLGGPAYRFYLQPKYSISGRVLGGFTQGNFTGDTGGAGTLGVLYPDGSTFAASASLLGEYNLTPNVGLRVAPEYYLTGFGSTTQNNLGFTLSFVYRFGKQK
jgi:hypothetical protein